MAAIITASTTRVRVLEQDPDLAAGIPPDHLALARQAVHAPVQTIPEGPWRYEPPDDPGLFGLLILEGLIAGRVTIPARSHLELVGPGDILRPWVSLAEMATTPSALAWEVLDTMRLAVLDRRFMHYVRHWPEIPSAMADRMVLRTRRLGFELAVVGLTGIEDRLLLMLWHFADRWGRVTAEGVKLRLPLTHAQLADVVEASRPTVSTAISSLRRTGAISGGRRGEWVLHGSPPERFWTLREQVDLQRS